MYNESSQISDSQQENVRWKKMSFHSENGGDSISDTLFALA